MGWLLRFDHHRVDRLAHQLLFRDLLFEKQIGPNFAGRKERRPGNDLAFKIPGFLLLAFNESVRIEEREPRFFNRENLDFTLTANTLNNGLPINKADSANSCANPKFS